MFFGLNLLNLIIISLLIGICLLLIWPTNDQKYIKIFSIIFLFLIFILSLFLLLHFDNSTLKFQFVTEFNWFSNLNINNKFGIDGISIFLILLTTLLFPICFLSSWYSINKKLKEYILCFFLIEFFLICVFSILDILLFYIFFEGILIPMFILVGIWGSREKKKLKLVIYYFYILYLDLYLCF